VSVPALAYGPRMRSLSVCVGACLAVLALCGAPAHAASTPLLAEPVAGPVFAGDAVLFGARDPRNALEIRAWTAGQDPRALAGFPARAADDWSSEALELAGSSTRLAYSLAITAPSGEGATQTSFVAASAPLTSSASPLEALVTCGPDLATVRRPIAVSEDAVAYAPGACRAFEDGTTPEVVVRDLAPGAADPTLTIKLGAQESVQALALAGRYVAWATVRTVVVYDRVARREVYRVGGQLSTPSPELGLQPDGTVATAALVSSSPAGGDLSCVVRWASPTSPTWHVAATARSCGTTLALAGDRIAFLRYGGRLLSSGAELVLVGLAGSERTVARFSAGHPLAGAIAFDGARVAWARVDCGSVTLQVEDVADPPAGAVTSRCGAPRVAPRSLRLRPDGSVALTLSCAGGCNGQVILATAVPSRPSAGIPFSRRVGFARFALPRRGRTRIAIPLTAKGRRLVARARGARIFAAVPTTRNGALTFSTGSRVLRAQRG